ncbi:unnamed protein product [Orchesella dallaii]|uniref:Cadherin domain-containing protein n=1 Tax=Orchesella dallaii TaxID=48710 RepID=A0ABP1RB06_9HEXA
MLNCIKSISFTCILVMVQSVPRIQSKVTCPLGENGWINLTQVPDVKTGIFFNGTIYREAYVAGVRFGTSLRNILDASFYEFDYETTVIEFSTVQPNFTNVLDFDGISSIDGVEYDGLLIDLDDQDQTVIACSVHLTIEDTNNQPPIFNKESVNFTIPSDWNRQVPLNWYFDNEIVITDEDFNVSNAEVNLISSNQVNGSLQLLSDETSSHFTYNVHIHMIDVVAGTHTIIASDGVNYASLNVVIEVEEKNTHPPVFQNTGYYKTFESMPKIGDKVPVNISAVDPDYPGTDIIYSVASDFVDYINGDIIFTKTDDLVGQVKTVAVTATENIPNGKSTAVNLTLKFEYQNDPKFTMPFFEINLFEYPNEGHVIANLNSLSQAYPETLSYQLRNTEHQFIEIIDGEVLQFTQNVTQLTDLGRNDYTVFDVIAIVDGDSTRNSSATFVITFAACKSNTCNCEGNDCPISKTGLFIGLVFTSVLSAVSIVVAGYLIWGIRNTPTGFKRKFNTSIRSASIDNLSKPSITY